MPDISHIDQVKPEQPLSEFHRFLILKFNLEEILFFNRLIYGFDRYHVHHKKKQYCIRYQKTNFQRIRAHLDLCLIPRIHSTEITGFKIVKLNSESNYSNIFYHFDIPRIFLTDHSEIYYQTKYLINRMKNEVTSRSTMDQLEMQIRENKLFIQFFQQCYRLFAQVKHFEYNQQGDRIEFDDNMIRFQPEKFKPINDQLEIYIEEMQLQSIRTILTK